MTIQLVDLGTTSYSDSLSTQQTFHDKVKKENLDGFILCVEHEPVITLGKHSNPDFVLKSEQFLQTAGVSIVHTDRGGEATAHEPGQLTVYPILRIENYGLSPKMYVDTIMYAVQSVLKQLGIESKLDCEHPGVWVGENKICAVGARIKQRVSMHGIALNVENDLRTFGYIIPCGIASRGVTSISRELGRVVKVADVMPLIVAEIIKRIEKYGRA